MVDAERLEMSLDRLILDDDRPAVAAITIAELTVGVEASRGRRRTARQAFLRQVAEGLPVVDYDLKVAHVHGSLLAVVRRSGRPRGAHDLIIAATAAATGRTVITADRRGFDDLPGVEVRTLGS